MSKFLPFPKAASSRCGRTPNLIEKKENHMLRAYMEEDLIQKEKKKEIRGYFNFDSKKIFIFLKKCNLCGRILKNEKHIYIAFNKKLELIFICKNCRDRIEQ